MKKLLALLAVVLCVVSCQTEPEGLDVNVGGEIDAIVNVTIPEAETRATNSAEGAFKNVDFNDYTIRYILQVYYNNEPSQERLVKYSDDNSVAFDVRLVPGRDYNFVVWADIVEGNDYVDNEWSNNDDLHYNTTNLHNITLKSTWVAMDETRDAFTGYYNTADHNVKYSSSLPINITLKRPFAKLRVVTTDLKNLTNLGITPYKATVSYANAHRESFNAYNGTYGDKTKANVNFTYNIASYDDNSETDKVLFTDYFFAVENDLVKFNLDVMEANGSPIGETVAFNTDIPVNANYLTTIKGNILTDGKNFNVTIDDAFANGTEWNPGNDNYDVEIWDGKSLKVPAYDAATETYSIKLGSELAWLAAAVNGTLETRAAAADSFNGKTFILTQDIDLGYNEWTPIGNSTNTFQGTFDGQGHTVANLLITGRNNYVGLFGYTTNGEIKELVVENAKVSGRVGVGVVAGSPYTSKFNNITVQGHVEVNGMAYVGGVGGRNAYANWENITVNVDETSYVNANSVENGTAYRTYVGGVVGFNGEGGHSFKNITSNIDVKGSTIDVGGLFGIAHYGNQFENCSCSGDVEMYAAEEAAAAQEIGGIAGVWHNGGADVVFTNCTFTGTLETNIDVDFYYGGLVGKPYSATGNGKLIIDGYEMVVNGLGVNDEGEYLVTATEGLEYIAEQVNAGNDEYTEANIVLDGDIDLAQLAAMTRSSVVANNWTPIGTEANPFKGSFDGNGKTIKNLALVESEAKAGKAFVGFFGYAKDATIKNVTFENVYINIPCLDIDHSQGHIGAVAGSLEGASTIENVTVKGDIKVEATLKANGASRVAVVAGGNSYGNVTMKNVHVIANDGSYLIANNNVGALAGQLQGVSKFENCSSNIDVTGYKFFAGGIIGLAAGDQIFTNCHTTGDVTILAGRSGRANDHYRVGGIAGGWADNTSTPCVLTNCTYSGEVSGTNADGSVAETLDYAGYVGRGYTLANRAGSTVIIDGVEYVQLYDNIYGVYTVNGAYAVNSAADLKALASLVNAGTSFEGVEVVLTADIDLKNENWTPIGSITNERGFCGNFDGRNHTIKNLTITNPALDADNYAYAGLFGITENNTIKNLTIENVNISTEGHIVAAAIAYPYYTNIENVLVKGKVNIKGGNYTAGVLAYTRRCVNAKDIAINANAGSVIEGVYTIGGVISDIQMNGGLKANYSNFEATGLTIKGTKCVGGISGIIGNQTLNGATVKNVAIVSDDARKGTLCGSFDGVCTITNAVVENVTGADNFIGGLYEGTASEDASIIINGVTYTYNNGWLVDGYKVLADGLLKKDNEYKVTSAAGLNYFSNKTVENGTVIKLAADIDFEGAEFKAIAAGYSKSLTFDGQNHTIKNVKIVTCSHNTVGSAGLFFCYPGGTLNVSNLVVENATSEGATYAGVITGYTQGFATLTNITVKDCNVSGVKKIGGLVGFIEASTSNFLAENCNVINTTVTATEKQAGTIIGYNAKPATLKNCTVENSTATAPAYCDGGVRCTDPAQAELTIE